jgi:hypothetical protein
MKQSPYIDDLGTKRWRNERGQLHRENGPAIEHNDGTKEWYLNHKLHREDGPAIEWANGSKSWWINGKLHREGGAAVEYSNGTKEWFFNGFRHRLDGPAVEQSNCHKEWWIDGELCLMKEFTICVIKFLLNCDNEAAETILKLLKN